MKGVTAKPQGISTFHILAYLPNINDQTFKNIVKQDLHSEWPVWSWLRQDNQTNSANTFQGLFKYAPNLI